MNLDEVLTFERAIPFNLASNYFRLLALTPLFIWLLSKLNRVERFRIQKKAPSEEKMKAEFRTALMATCFFTTAAISMVILYRMGISKIYFKIEDHAGGWGYWGLSLVMVLILHDAYFYWIHRLMHYRPIYRFVHAVHHRATNPTAYSANAFHVLEVFFEVGIVPVVTILLPLHVSVLVAYTFFQFTYALMVHSGFEFAPISWFKHPILKYVNFPLNHNLHHSKFSCNYGLYFNFWDRWMGTLDKNYGKEIDALEEKRSKGTV